MNIETDTLLNDISQSYMKLSIECKKKSSPVKEAIDLTMKAIDSLKLKAWNNINIFNELSQDFSIFLLPLQRLTEAKLIKLFPISILIIKILVGYRFLTATQYNELISLIKDLFYQSNEEHYPKLLDVLEEIVNHRLLQIKEDVVSKIVSICFKIFIIKNNTDIKLNIASVFPSFINNIYDPIKDKLNTMNEVAPSVITNSYHFKGAIHLLESLIDIIEGKNKEFSSNATHLKCFALEIIAYTLTNHSESFIQIPLMMDITRDTLSKCLLQSFEKANNDFYVTLKLCRCSLVLIHKITIESDLIQQFLRLSEVKDIGWTKWLGIESISSILNNPQIVIKIYQNILLADMFFTSFHKSIKTINAMVLETNLSPLKKKETFDYYNLSRTKGVENASIITNSEPIPNVNTMMIYALIADCLENYKNSILKIVVSKEIELNELNFKLTKEQSDIKDMIKFKNDLLRESLTDTIEKSFDEDITLRYLNLFQNFIHIYGSIYLPNARDSYLQNLCDLAVPGNVQYIQDLPDKNFCIIKTLFNIVSFVNLLETSSWVIILQTMQYISRLIDRFNLQSDKTLDYNAEYLIKTLENNIDMYSINNNNSKDLTRITSNNFTKSTTLMPNDNSLMNDHIIQSNKLNSDRNGKDHALIITNLINSFLINSNSYNKDTLDQIGNAIYTNCRKAFDASVNESTASYLNFHLKKMLKLAWVNYYRIEIIYCSIAGISNFLVKKNIRSLSQYTLDIHTMIIIHEINNYKPNEKSHEEWTSRNFQRSLLIPLMKEASQNISDDINVCILSNLSRILDFCGKRLSVFGWSTLIETCSIMLNQNAQNQFELTFKIIDRIMNDFAEYLNVYNITPLLNILEAFTFYQSNNTICLTAIELIKSCAKITEKYQTRTQTIDENQLKFFNQFYPDPQSKEEFFNELWKHIFYKVVNINSDERFEVRKKGIVVISDIFVDKIRNFNQLNSKFIIREIFIRILKTNSIQYEEKLKSKDKGECTEWEETTVESLQALKKGLKAYFASCEDETKIKELYKEFIDICTNIVHFCSPNFIIQINKANTDLIDNNNKFIVLNFEYYWTYLNKLIEYFSTEAFIKKYENDAIGVVIVLELVQNVRKIIQSYMQLPIHDESLFLLLISYYQQLLSCAQLFEKHTVIATPNKLLNCEKEIFQVIDENITQSVSKTEMVMLFEFLSSHLSFSKIDEHTEALCRRSLQSLVLLHSNPCFNYEENIKGLLTKIKPLIFVRNNPDMVETIMKRRSKGSSNITTKQMSSSCTNANSSHNNSEGEYLWNIATNDFIKIIQKIITHLQAENIWNIVLDYLESVFKESNNGFKKISKAYIDELIRSIQKLEIAHISLLVNYLVPNSIFVSKEIQLKLCELLDLAAHIDYSSVSINSSAISKVCLTNLFELSKYKSEEDIRKEQPNYTKENLDKYVSIKVRIAKMCTPILIKRCREMMKKFLSDEVKSGSMPLSRTRLDEIKFLLENLSNLEIYPHYTIIDDETRLPDEDGLEDKETIMGIVSKTKKAHLFLLHPILSQFIATKENDIKLLIKELFGKISKEMGIKSG